MSDEVERAVDPGRHHWAGVTKRTIAKFMSDGGPDLAAALTYFAVMSLAPMLLALSTSLSFLGQADATRDVVQELGTDLGLSQSTIDTVVRYLDTMGGSGIAGTLLIVGLLGAVWSASNYVNAFSRMMNRVYQVREGRAIWKLRPWLFVLTIVVLLLIMTIVLSVSLSGAIADFVLGAVGLSALGKSIWNVARWPFVLGMLVLIVALLYWGTPNVRQPSFRWLSPGAALAVVVSILAAAGFGLYLTGFGGEDNYNQTYGAIGGVIILLLLLFIINNVLVLGAELDAELERGRQLAAGMAAEERILLPPRDARGTRKQKAKAAERVREARELRMRAARELAEEGEEIGLPGRDQGRARH